MPLLSVCRKTQGLIRGRSPLWLYSDLATCAANPQKALAQQGFPCIRCWPRHRRKHRMKKLKKVAFSHFFDTLKGEQEPSLYKTHPHWTAFTPLSLCSTLIRPLCFGI